MECEEGCCKWFKDIVLLPQAWNIFCEVVGFGSLILGAYLLLGSCAEGPSATALGCAETAAEIDTKYYVLFIGSAYVIVTSTLHLCLMTARLPCFGCSGIQTSICLAGSTAVAATVVAGVINDLSDEVPKSAISTEPVCVACPDANNGLYRIIMWAGPVFLWVGFFVVFVALFSRNVIRKDEFRDSMSKSLNMEELNESNEV